jgi:hypothetical protein
MFSLLVEMDLINFLLELASSLNPPNLHLPSSWDYSCELLYLASGKILLRSLSTLVFTNILLCESMACGGPGQQHGV